MIIRKQFAEDQYSKRLYSTGNEELDNLLERAFCEGYELGQREFGNPQNKAAKRKYETVQGLTTYKDATNTAYNSLSKKPGGLSNIKLKSDTAKRTTRFNQIYGGNPNTLDQKISYKGWLEGRGKNDSVYKKEFNLAVKHPYKNFGDFEA